MIAAKVNPASISKRLPEEEEALLERASAPTLRDLRTAAEGMFTNVEAETDSSSSDESVSRHES
jgi:hypothetical protein